MSSVLIMTPQYPERGGSAVGGLYTHAQELVEGLRRQGVQATVLTARLEGPTVVEGTVHRVRPGARVLSMPMGGDGNPTPAQLELFNEELVAYVKELAARTGWRPEVIHCHDFWMVPCGLELRRAFGARLVISVHMLHAPLRQWWGAAVNPLIAEVERRYCHEADVLIAVSQSMRDILQHELGVAASRVRVVHNGFDAAPFLGPLPAEQERQVRERWGLVDGRVVVFAGRLVLQKGLGPLMAAAARVVEGCPQVVYALAGVSRQRQPGRPEASHILDELERLWGSHPEVAARVRPLGNLGREDLARLYRLADLAVVPSVYEPFGYAAVEPMAAGVPVVATAVGGLGEIIQEGESGLLVPVHRSGSEPHTVDIQALASAQLRVLREPALAQRLGREGQARVLTRFTQDTMAAQTLAAYQEVL